MPKRTSTDPYKMPQRWLSASRIAIIYASVGILWILSSDWVLFQLIGTAHDQMFGAIMKGIFYVVATACLVYFLVRALNRGLEKSEERYRTIVENQTEFIVRWKPDGSRSFVNPAYCKYFEITPEQAAATSFFNKIPAEDAGILKGTLKKLSPQNPEATAAQRMLKQDGSIVWIDWTHRSIFDKMGRLVEIQSIGRDVTAKVETAERLRESEELFRRTFEETFSGMAHQTLDGRFVRVNQRLCEILGYSREELLEKTFQEITYPGDLQENLINSKKLITGEINHYQTEKRYIRKDGSLVWADVNVSVLRNASGEPLNFVVAAEDITEHKKMLARIEHLNSVLAAVRDVNQLITKENDPACLIREACKILVTVPVFESARIVLLGNNDVVADDVCAGTETDRILSVLNDNFLKEKIVAHNTPIQENGNSSLFVCTDNNNPDFLLHRYSDNAFGMTVTLRFEDKLHGMLAMITQKDYAYVEQDVSLFQEVAGDIGFALSKIAMQHALEESEEKFRIFADVTYDWENWIAPDGRHIYVSPSCERITGYPPQAFYDDPQLLQKIVYKDDREEYLRHKEDVLKKKADDCTGTFRIVRPDGEIRWIGHVCQLVIDKDGRYLGRRGSNRDITPEKLSEIALRESRQRYRDLFNAVSDAIFLHEMSPNGPGKFIDVNEEACQRLQYTKEAFLEMTPLDINAFNFEPREMIGTLFKNGKVTFISNHLRKDKKAIPVEIASSLFEWDGRTVVLSVARDVTERVLAEKQIRESKELLETILENIPVMVAFFDHEMHMTWANRQLQQTLGWSLEEAKTTDIFEICYPDTESRQAAIQYIRSLESQWKDFKTRRRDGTVLDTTWANMPLSDGTTVGIGLDITERKRTEQNLLRLYAAIEQLPDLVMIAGQRGVVEYVNPAFERITGYSRDEIIGKTPKFMSAEDENFQEINTAVMDVLLKGKSWSGIMKNNTKDGALYYQDTTMAPVFGPNNVPIAYVGIGRDVTHEVKRETAMRQSQKLEAIGALAGGIAHDFNNILQGILGYTQLVYDSLPESQNEKHFLHEVLVAVERAAGLIKQILTFSRQAEQEPRPLQLHLILREALKLMRGTIPSNIKIEERISTKCGAILADPIQMHQVIMNLCTNAWHAMRETGGTITVELSEVVITETMNCDAGTITPGNAVLLSVKDTGCGMNEETLERVFEPYFTTKQKTGGTGLGLATVHGIVLNCKGAIVVESKPDRGTVFKIYIPVIQMQISTDPERRENRNALTGKGKLLIVDDEAVLLDITRRALTDIGFEVTSARNGEEALRLFMATPDKFDLLLTDMTMPGMLGSQLSAQVKAIRPGLPVLMLTGFSDLLDEDIQKLCGINKILMKPVGVFDLAKSIMELIKK